MDEINSPLPPRRTNIPEEQPVEEKPTEEKVSEEILPQNRTEPIMVSSKPTGLPLAKAIIPRDNRGPITIALIGLAIIALILVVVKVLIPRLKGSGKTAGEKTIVYWGLWEDDSLINGVLADFETKNPGIKVKYIKNSKIDYRSRLQGRLAKDPEAEEVPDLFRFHSSWVPMMKNYLDAAPDETAQKLELENDFYRVYQNDLKIGKSYVGIPLMYDGLALFYNKDIIEKSQMSLPRTWWDFQETATKVTVKDQNGKITVAGAGMGLADNVDHWSDILGLIMKQNGIDILNLDAATEAKLKNVLNFYTLFRTRDEVWNESLPTTTEMFASGKLAFYFGPSWRIFNLEEMKPTLNPQLEYEVIGVPQLPVLEEGEELSPETRLTDIQWATYWAEGVNARSKNQKEAWKLLEFLAAKENLEVLYRTASQVRYFGELYPRRSMGPMLTDNLKASAFLQGADSASSGYLSSRTYDAGLNDQMSDYFKNAINAIVFDKESSDSVVETLKKGIQQLKQKYELR
ncbi:MAG: extracellular solute-binding protein [Candidatus Shapirobacteria bacterium]|jgi:ABC-type glycerol-3-phosphate transport system substrate-binding protein